MGASDNDGRFRGGIGNLTYRIIGGKSIIQSRPGPGKMKRTKGTKARNVDFCLASNRAKILRLVLMPMLKGNYDRWMVNRFNAAVTKVVRSNTSLASGYRDLDDGNLDLLNGFEFNLNSPFSKLLQTKLQLEQTYFDGIRISLNAFEVSEVLFFPRTADGCHLKILVSAIRLQDNQYQYCGAAEMKIPLGTKDVLATTWTFKESLPEDCLLMATCSLEYYVQGLDELLSLNRKDFHPVSLIGLVRSQEVEALTMTALSEGAASVWKKWLPIPGIDGNKLRLR